MWPEEISGLKFRLGLIRSGSNTYAGGNRAYGWLVQCGPNLLLRREVCSKKDGRNQTTSKIQLSFSVSLSTNLFCFGEKKIKICSSLHNQRLSLLLEALQIPVKAKREEQHPWKDQSQSNRRLSKPRILRAQPSLSLLNLLPLPRRDPSTMTPFHTTPNPSSFVSFLKIFVLIFSRF